MTEEVIIDHLVDLYLKEGSGGYATSRSEVYLAVDLGGVCLSSSKMCFTDGVVILAKNKDSLPYHFSVVFLVYDELIAHQSVHSVYLYLLVYLGHIVSESALLA